MLLIRLVILFLLVGNAWSDESACADSQVSREYDGPLFDAMAQIDSSMSNQVVAALNDSGVSHMALFARMHRKRNGERAVSELKEHFGPRVVMGTPKSFEQRGDLSDEFVEKTLTHLKDSSFQFVGEIMFAHADKSHGEQTQEGERYVAPTGSNVAKLFAELSGHNIPVMTHWEVYNWERDWAAFDHLYTRFRGVTFIWPHAGFATASQVHTVLSSHANVFITLSKKESIQDALSSEEKTKALGGPLVDQCNRLLSQWRELLEKYPDRFMFATDSHKDFRWARYPEIVKQWRHILGQLSAPIAKAIASGNAERLYGGLR